MSDLAITPEDLIIHYTNRLMQHIDDTDMLINSINCLIKDIEFSWESSSANAAIIKLRQMSSELAVASANIKEAKTALSDIG